MELIYQPWPWYVAGPLIALVMFLLIYSGKTFGLSSNLRTLCTIGGAGRFRGFFDFDWKKDMWNLVFLAGSIIGGFLTTHFLVADNSVGINPKTVETLEEIGISGSSYSYLPPQLFSFDAAFSFEGFLILIIAGFLVGFGSRYAGGCTSGHAISGISDLQIPSFIAVIGFFIGGLIMTFFILPLIMTI